MNIDKLYDPNLYFVVECFVNKGELGDAGSDMRRGYIDGYLISGTGPTSYTYRGVKEEPIWNFSNEIIEEWKDIPT